MSKYAFGWTTHGAGVSINSGAGMGVASPPFPTYEVYDIDEKVMKMSRYAELCGDEVEIVELAEGEECTDVKVIMLKAARVGEVIKDVGIKIRDDKFLVYREK